MNPAIQTTEAIRTENRRDALLTAYDAARDVAQEGIAGWAKRYKACIDGGIDMRKERGVGVDLGNRLCLVAEGKLLPMSELELTFLPRAHVKALAVLPIKTQEKVVKDGVSVWRDGKAKKVSFSSLSTPEVNRVVDTSNGRGRVVSPEEQAERIETVPGKTRDHEVSIRFTYPEYQRLHVEAKKTGRAIPTLIKDALREAGLIK